MAATFRERVIDYLAKHGNQIEDDNATGKLAKRMRIPTSQMGSLSSALKRMEENGEIERSVEGKRTKGIYLLEAAFEPAPNGQEPAEKAVAEDYAKLGLEVLQAASKALQDSEKLEQANKELRRELTNVRNQLQALELQNAALERQVEQAKATAERVAANLSTDVKRDVQALLTKVKKLG